MSKSKRYTKEQKHLIKQCIIDADIMGLDRSESITYVKSRLGLDDKTFSEGSYKKYRKRHYQMTITLIGYRIVLKN